MWFPIKDFKSIFEDNFCKTRKKAQEILSYFKPDDAVLQELDRKGLKDLIE